MEESPVCAVLDESNKLYRCTLCFKPKATLRCSGCSQCLYCDRNCQKNDWKLHKFECKAFKKASRNLNMTIRYLMRLLYTCFLFPEQAIGLLDPIEANRVKYSGIASLVSHYDLFSAQKLEDYELIGKGLELFMEPDHLATLMHRILLLCISSCNSMTISDPDGTIGGGLYPNLCKLNHACKPNTVIVFEGTKANVYSIERIAKGQELFFSYIDFVEKDDRKRQIQNTYFFDCSCEWCSMPNEPLSLLLCPGCSGNMSCRNWTCLDCGMKLDYSIRITISDFIDSFDPKEEYSTKDLQDFYENSLKYLRPSHLTRYTISNEYYHRMLKEKDWKTALKVSLGLVETWKELYGPTTYRLGIQYFVSSTLAEKTNDSSFTFLIREAARLLNIFAPKTKLATEATIKASHASGFDTELSWSSLPVL